MNGTTPHLRLFPLSRRTAGEIRWAESTRQLEALAEEFGAKKDAAPPPAQEAEPLTPADRQRLTQAFAKFSDEFGRVLEPLRKRNSLFNGLVALAVVVTFIGAVLAFFVPFIGTITSVSGLGSLITLLVFIWRLERDQAMLTLVPARYELATKFCYTRQDMRDLLRVLLDECSSLNPSGRP